MTNMVDHWYGVTSGPSTAQHRATSFPPQFIISDMRAADLLP